MSKPEDIPQEVWDIADGVRLAQRWLPHAMNNYSRATTEFIARAAMTAEKRGAERERQACAKHLNARAGEFRAGATITSNTMAMIFDDLADEIRKRGTTADA